MSIHILDLHFLGIPEAIAAFLIKTETGAILVESGPHSTFPALEQALAPHGVALTDIQAVLLTHIHFDHAGAAWALAEKGAPIYVHPKGAPHLASPEKLYHSASLIYGDQMETLWGKMLPIAPEKLVVPEHGQTFTLAGLPCTAWYTPGHASHHIAWQVGDVLFAGDTAGVRIGKGPVVPPCPPPDIDVEAWLSSIALMENLPVSAIYLTHYGLAPFTEGKRAALHFSELADQLRANAAWIKPFFEQGVPQETVVPQFKEFTDAFLSKFNLTDSEKQRYEAANPAFMSVAGLYRYWKKRSDHLSTPTK